MDLLARQCWGVGEYEGIGFAWHDDCERNIEDWQFEERQTVYLSMRPAADEESAFDIKAAAIGASTGVIAFFAVVAVVKSFRKSKQLQDDSFTRVNEPLL